MRGPAELKLGRFRVGEEHPPLVVAEIGINHGGSLDKAKSLVALAVENGARVIKHQTHTVWDEMSEEAKTRILGNSSRSIYDIIEKNKLDSQRNGNWLTLLGSEEWNT